MSFTFTIIIPHQNIPILLERCLKSIPERDDVEILVIDDHSKKEDYYSITAIRHKNLTIYRLPYAQGAGVARNFGIDRAHGDWIIFADTDDIFTEKLPTVLDKYKGLLGTYDIIAFPICEKHVLNSNNIDFAEKYNEQLLNETNSERKRIISCCTCWPKMYNALFLKMNAICFDSCIYGNDIGFSVRSAVNSKKSLSIRNTTFMCIYVVRDH